ncbi:MAG: hypothetical protein A2521_06600 [Deltaproteobacteria bacterium RIFOXYD12_FULL_57_12]|nr:MAG: hypothetical protein A2521_06600 [Deltaproteobacteria bacterium RIFOXYD12_FULL_57_12]
MIRNIIVFFFFAVFLLQNHAVLAKDSNQEPPLLLPTFPALHIQEPVMFCGERVPVDRPDVREILEKELLMLLGDPAQVILWLQRTGRYFPQIEKTLQDNNLPDDLKYVAVIESGLRPHAGSSKGALGFWQFMESTGRRYGLTINGDKDERRSLTASTIAASRYLKDLRSTFGTWALAIAAYNMGEDQLRADLMNQDIDDYYKCYLSLETQAFIPKIVAVKLIISNPGRYGFDLKPGDMYQPYKFDQVTVSIKEKVPLRLIAFAAGSYFKEIKELNPELRGDFLTGGPHTLAVPQGGGGSQFHTRFDKLLAEWKEKNKKNTYIVQQGDNLSTIAERFNIPLSSLLGWNDLPAGQHIQPGKKLVIYR